jgi:integrase
MGTIFRLWVLPLIGSIPVNMVTGEHLAKIRDNYMAHGHMSIKPESPTPMRQHTLGGAAKLLVDLRTLLNFCVKQGLVTALAAKVPIPRTQKQPIQAMTAGDVLPFLDAIDAEIEDPQTRLAVRLMLFMGLRISEIISMRWNWFRSDFTSYIPGETKGREADGIPLLPDFGLTPKSWTT